MIQLITGIPKDLYIFLVIDAHVLESCLSFVYRHQYVNFFNSMIRLLQMVECDSNRQLSEVGFHERSLKASESAILTLLEADWRLFMR